MKVPVLFIIFNRPDIAAKSFESIKKYKPDKLYIAADGPRKSRPEDVELCKKTRETILNMIDWACDVKTLFRDENVGVDWGVYGAINWFFETEPWGVIIEDDCIISQDFYSMCEIAFPKYAKNPNVMHIASNNPITSKIETSQLFFSHYPMTWGWGTWADKWKNVMDPQMKSWNNNCLWKLLWKYGVIGLMFYIYWRLSYRDRALIRPWDNIWQYSVMSHDGLSLMAEVNLSYNNGIGTSEGSHYKVGESNFYEELKVGALKEPYISPNSFSVSRKHRTEMRNYFIRLRWYGLKKRLNLIK